MSPTDDGTRIRVVLADDAPEVRMLLRLMLDVDGRFEVVGESADGATAIETVENTGADVVLLDLAMPVMDGLQAIPEIVKRCPETRIVVLSGFDAAQMSSEALARGAHAYVVKGTDMTDLVGTVTALFGERATRAQLQGKPLTRQLEPSAAPSREASRDQLSEVLPTLIHELQTPVTVILGFATTLKAALERMDPTALTTAVSAIQRSAGNLQSLIRTLADARAIDSGQLDIETERVDIGEWVKEAVADLAMITDPHDVIVVIEGGGPVHIDTVRIRQVLTNLLSNAAKFSPDEEPIEVVVARGGGEGRISVTDRGAGIPRHRVSELFQKFSRLESKAPGTGLGLYISRGIARAHGGELSMTSRGDDGSTFTLTLPLDD